jgi:hypothetical protein
VDELGLPDRFIDHGDRAQILEDSGLAAQSITRDVVAQVVGSKIPVARPLPDESGAGASLSAQDFSVGSAGVSDTAAES